jgi:hypothetical protein
MIDVINKISLEDTVFNSSTIEYMNESGMKNGPEDVYFSFNMIKYNIGKVADWDSAFNFSSESFFNPNALGGHDFWIGNSNWKQTLYDNIIVQYKMPTYDINEYEHRGGYTTILKNLIYNDFFSTNSNINFFDIIEKDFIWYNSPTCNTKWAGIIHCTQYAPNFLKCLDITNLFLPQYNFINSLDNCLFIIVFSNYVANYLHSEFKKINKNIKIHVLKYPVEQQNIIMFDFDKYVDNTNKKIIQIGQQLRKMTSIYLLKTNNDFEKLWLTGTKNFKKCMCLMSCEINEFKIQNVDINTVKMKYTDTFQEYDVLLSENIVFIDLFDTSANNTVLECIVRNTPIIVNKLPAVVEYLGENYPLYFNTLDEASELLCNNELLLKAHNYLKLMDKTEFSIDYFTKKMMSLY